MSLGKVLLLLGAIAIAWWGLRWYQRRQQAVAQDEARLDGLDREGRGRRKSAAPPPQTSQPEEMIACAQCGAYVPQRGARSCGKAACPFT